MQRYIALLRAINVGGHNVKMEQLRALFAALGFTSVETFIASGNVIFESPEADAQALERQIEEHLHRSLGYAVATFLRTPSELAAIASHQPFAGLVADGALYVGFLPSAPSDLAVQKLVALRTEIDQFHANGREFYWFCRTGMGASSISGALLERTIALPATLRNVTTVRRLAAKYPAER